MLELKSFEMIEKADFSGGYQCVLEFGDNTQLSIISGNGAYGNKNAPYEIAVFKNGDFAGLPGIIDVDSQVRGYLTESEIDVIIKKMYLVTGKYPSQV